VVSKIDSALTELLAQYLTSWGPISWRHELSSARLNENMIIGRAVLSLSAIETDSRVIYRKLHTANLDHRQIIREFNISWLAEEAEHGRALRCLAGRLGVCDIPPDRRSRASLRSTIAWPSLTMARILGSALEATYLTLGAMQEYVALTTYRKLADLIGDPHAALVLRRIAMQEGRHMHFYRGAALVLLEDPWHAYVASRLLGRLWRPPGVDLLGLAAWLDAFGPLLTDDDYRAQLLKLDPLVRRMPGFDGVELMKTFLLRNGYAVASGGRSRAKAIPDLGQQTGHRSPVR
jgi:hypothetical protein